MAQMSASTVSITAHQGQTTRRRTVEKTLASGGSDIAAAAEADNRLSAGDAAATILRDARKNTAQKKSGQTRKQSKPRWLTVVSVLTKNLALIVLILGVVRMLRGFVMNAGPEVGDYSVISGDFDGKMSELRTFVSKTAKLTQVQMNAIDKKYQDQISAMRKEFGEKIEKQGNEVDLKLKALDARSDAFEKFMDGFTSKRWLTQEEFDEFLEEFKKYRNSDGGGVEVSMDDIKDYVRETLLKEIEKHAADGLGMVDYALASGGAKVLKHSDPFGGLKGIGFLNWFLNPNSVSDGADKMIRPSFGEPGHCFPLKGGQGFVEIRLRDAIVPEAVTLEHVAKSVAYDRSSAPKDCLVYGWLAGQDSPDTEIGSKNMFLLTEFTYDLEKNYAQTFKVESAASHLVDTIRLDFTSNHGAATHTCIYRLRVHGYKPHLVPTEDQKMQS